MYIYTVDGKRKKGKMAISCLLQAENRNGILFSLVGKQETVIGNCCFSKCAQYATLQLRILLCTFTFLPIFYAITAVR